MQKKVKQDPSKSYIYRLKEDNEKHFLAQSEAAAGPLTGKQKAVLWLFGLSFLVMVLGVIPWADKFGITIFEDINNRVQGIPVIGTVLGKITPLGSWWFGDITVWFLIVSLVCWVIWRWEEMKFIALFLDGAKDLLGVALIIGVTRGISIVMNDGGLTATLLNFGEQSLQALGPVAFTDLSTIFFAGLSFLVPSTSGLAALSMPIMAPIADFAGVGRDLVITAFQVGSGLVNFITPTSGVLMGALALARIPYGAYLKWIWKFMVIITGVCIVTLSAAAILG